MKLNTLNSMDFMNDQFNLFKDFMNGPMLSFDNRSTASYDLYKNDDKYLLEVAFLGVEKEDINIEIKKSVLSISTDPKSSIDSDSGKGKQITSKIFRGYSKKLNLALSEEIDQDNVTSSFKNGILSVTLPLKQKEENIKAIKIE